MFWKKKPKASPEANPVADGMNFMTAASSFLDQSGTFIRAAVIFREAGIADEHGAVCGICNLFSAKILELTQVQDYSKLEELENELSLLGHSIIFAADKLAGAAERKHLNPKFIEISILIAGEAAKVLKSRGIPLNLPEASPPAS